MSVVLTDLRQRLPFLVLPFRPGTRQMYNHWQNPEAETRYHQLQ